jgi:hypothetical protein
MGFIDNLLDRFNKTEFSVSPKRKLKVISKEFLKAFDLALVFYKGKQLADPEFTIAELNSKISKDIKFNASDLKIKGSMKVGEVEELFEKHFGLTVQIKDKSAKILVPNEITLGQAARGEYKK